MPECRCSALSLAAFLRRARNGAPQTGSQYGHPVFGTASHTLSNVGGLWPRHASANSPTRFGKPSRSLLRLMRFFLRGNFNRIISRRLQRPAFPTVFTKRPKPLAGYPRPRSFLRPCRSRFRVDYLRDPSPTPTGRGHATSGPDQAHVRNSDVRMPLNQTGKAKELERRWGPVPP